MRFFICFIFSLFASPALAQELPVEMRKDMFMSALAENLKAKDFEKSLQLIRKLHALGLELPPSIDFFEGEASCHVKKFKTCETTLKRYLLKRGKEGRYYSRALALLAANEEGITKEKTKIKRQKEEELRKAKFIPILVQNKCSEKIKLLIRFKNYSNKWEIGGWNYIGVSKSVKLKNIKIHMNGEYSYYAKTYDSKNKWENKKGKKFEFGEKRKKCLRKKVVKVRDEDSYCKTGSYISNDWTKYLCDICLRHETYRDKYNFLKVLPSSKAKKIKHSLVLECDEQTSAKKEWDTTFIEMQNAASQDGLNTGSNTDTGSYERARAFSRKRQYALAIPEYDKIIAQDQKNADLYNSRAWAYFKLKKIHEALLDARQAIRIDPDHANAFDTLAHILEVEGDTPSAIAAYRRALSLNPSLTGSKIGLRRLGERE